jgi:hypothetical protein
LGENMNHETQEGRLSAPGGIKWLIEDLRVDVDKAQMRNIRVFAGVSTCLCRKESFVK